MSGKKNKRPTIPNKVYNLLWAIGAGRCYICNKLLYQDLLTKRNVNSAYVAHIIDVNPKTHRYDEILSPKLAKDISNLMLLCDTHHRLIDNEAEAEYTVPRLKGIKQQHEDRIKKLTSILSDKQSFIIQYSAPIGKRIFHISEQEIENAMVLDGYYPADDTPITLSLANTESKDSEEDFWLFHSRELIRKYNRVIGEKVLSKEITQASVFAIAPQPLLILLGILLGDIKTTHIYPKNREGISWGWRTNEENNDFFIKSPNNTSKNKIALNISISANVHNDRIRNTLGDDTSIWEIRISNYSNDFLKSPYQSKHFRAIVKEVLDKIKHIHGEDTCIHVFPAIPAALAIEFGKVRMPKADLPMVIYDQNRDKDGFIEALKLPDCINNIN